MEEKEESKRTLALSPGGQTLRKQSEPLERSDLNINRRHILKRAGMLLGASGALAALATPAGATGTDGDADEIVGLWVDVISAPDNSFPPFSVFEVYGGGGTWIGSGQLDLTPAALSSTAWGIWQRLGDRKFRQIGRFWTYGPNATPTGFATLDLTVTVSEDGKTSHGEGSLQFFDNNGNPLGPASRTFDDGTRIASP